MVIAVAGLILLVYYKKGAAGQYWRTDFDGLALHCQYQGNPGQEADEEQQKNGFVGSMFFHTSKLTAFAPARKINVTNEAFDVTNSACPLPVVTFYTAIFFYESITGTNGYSSQLNALALFKSLQLPLPTGGQIFFGKTGRKYGRSH